MRLLPALFLAVASLVPLSAQADEVCKPARGALLAVSGVAANDTLNLRDKPGSEGKLIARIRPTAKGIKASGRSNYRSDACAVACLAVAAGANKTALAVAKSCKAKGLIWYEVTSPRGAKGWASGRFLVSDNVAVPLPMPVDDPFYRYTCQNGDRINVTLRAATKDAEVVNKAGRFLYLGKKSGIQAINYASPAFGGMTLNGNERRVTWQAPGKDATVCAALP